MNKLNRLLSALLAVLMLFSAFSVVASAASDKEDEIPADERIQNTYLTTIYKTPEEKLASMKLMLEKDGHRLYVDPVSGEVATQEIDSGNILFSNPYDVSGPAANPKDNGSDSTKKQILSQLVVQYIENGTTKSMYSFEEAAMREQIKVLQVKNGVRVEYTIGREESRKLVPRWISRTNFEKLLRDPIRAAAESGQFDVFYADKFESFYSLQALAEKTSQKAKDMLLQTYPICEKMDIYTFASDASAVELNWCEAYIKAYCPDYSFEQMDADHEETGYEATDEKFPVFKMALEYSLDENGLDVTLPCNGLRYDMAAYTLEYISILPYMGAGSSDNPGYNFYPDGSGSLFDFEQLNTKSTTTIKGKVYGTDYAYHTITGTYQKTIRYPVYGTVAGETIYEYSYIDAAGNPGSAIVSNTIMSLEDIEADLKKNGFTLTSEIEANSYKRGYVAVIEEGESLAELATYHAGALSKYNTLMNYFNPKPKDSYDVLSSLSVSGAASQWTVTSERKYTGSIKIHYQLLSDPEIGKATGAANPGYTFYDTTWLGMAEAYRDYLITSGTLTKLTAQDIQSNSIPLYLEVFGALETQQTIMTIPVDVMTPLTTFENIKEMYTELSENGVKNINFKMTGFANGGLYYTVPAAVKWEKAVGGKSGLADLVAEANRVNSQGDGSHLGLYPDFDFAYIQMDKLFDSTNLKKDAIKTIDNRYTSYRQYSATMQEYVSFYQLAISPSRYEKFYTKMLKNYQEFGLTGMSVATLGTALNSDFDEDEPYNREDNKEFTKQAMQNLKDAGYSLMTEGANAYTWGYVDHILNVDLDSSRYVKSSASVPFIGAVLHGYVQFAGPAFNEEGDTDYAILRAIENGAGIYFILSYQNTHELKEDAYYSQYYSVRYDIWEDDVIDYYNELNSILSDVQLKVIIDHRFLVGERVLDTDELEADIFERLEAAAKAELERREEEANREMLNVANAWYSVNNAVTNVSELIAKMEAKNAELYDMVVSLRDENGEYLKDENGAIVKKSTLDAQIDYIPSAVAKSLYSIEGTPATLLDQIELIEGIQAGVASLATVATNALRLYEEQKQLAAQYNEILAAVGEAEDVIDASSLSNEVKANLKQEIAAIYTQIESYKATVEGLLAEYAEYAADTGDKSITAKAVAALDLYTIPDKHDLYYLNGEYVSIVNNVRFTAETLHADAALEEETEEDKEESTEDAYDKYLVDNNRIVAVTYGDRDDATHNKTAYKTFLLNYNNYAVRVTYDGITYTIPSGGYVVLYH